MSEQYHEDPFTENLSHALYQTTSLELLQRVVDLQPRQSVLDTQAAIRKPTTEKLDASAGFWSEFAVVVAEETLASIEEPTSIDIFTAYTQSVGVTSGVIDYIKKRTIGLHSTTAESNVIISRMLDSTALEAVRLHSTKLNADKNLEYYSSQVAHDLTHDDRQAVAWKGIKISHFWNMVGMYQGLAKIGEGMKGANPTPEQAQQMQTENDALFSATELMLQYGIKPAIAPSRLKSTNIREWLVQSRKSVEAGIEAAIGTDSPHERARRQHDMPWIALFMATDQTFTTSKTEIVQHGDLIHKNLASAGFNAEGLIKPVDADKTNSDATIRLGRDGHLYSAANTSLRDRFNPVFYEELRADILSVYADLVVPIYVVDLYSQEAEAMQVPQTAGNGNDLRTLVLSRERVLRELGADICTQLEDERNKAERDMVEHDVIGHVRRLPSNYRASQEARDFCKADLGYVLAEFGETYVRDHKRGNKIVETLGHRAELKHVASAAVKATVATAPARSKNTSRKKQKRRR